jgi:hypothetical protein
MVKPPPPGEPTPLTPHLLITSPSVGTRFNGGLLPETIVVTGTVYLTCDDPGGDCAVGSIYRVTVQLGDSAPQQATLNLDGIPAPGTEESGSWSFMGAPQPGVLGDLSITATLTALTGVRPHQRVETAESSITVFLQPPPPPPPEDPVLAACAKLNSTVPLRPSPPLETLDVGQYDASRKVFTWAEGSPFYQTVEVIQPDPNDPGGPTRPIRVIHHCARVTALVSSVSVDLINNASTEVAFTVNDKTAVAPAGSAKAIVEGPFVNNVLFSISEGVTQLGIFELRLVSALLESGCIVVPAFPVAVIYQPPTGTGTLTTTDTTGVALTELSSDIFSNATPTDLSAIGSVLHFFGDFLQTVGDISDIKAANIIGDALNTFGDTLSLVPSGGAAWGVRVQANNRVEVTAAIGQSWSSVPQLGPGDGDVILYLQDLTFLVYKDSEHTLITPLRFTGTEPQDVTVARLRPGAAQPPALSDAARSFLLQFDPVAAGNPGAIMQGARYTFVDRFTEDNEGLLRTLEWSHTEQSTLEEIHSVALADGTPSSAGMASKYARQGHATTASVQATGPFDFEVYYDNLFGTFAYVNKLGPFPAFQTNVAPGLAAVGDSFMLFAKSTDGRIFTNRCVLGQNFQGWVEVEGGGRTDAAPAAAALGTYMFVAVKGLDGRVWLNQGELGQPFIGWGPIDGLDTDAAPGLAAVGDSFMLFAKSTDGRIFTNRCVLGQNFQGWVEVEGGGRTDAAPAAAALGTYMFVAVKGLDGRVWLNQGELGQPFTGWGLI